MKKTNVINLKGENVKELKLNEAIFGIEPNDVVLKKALRLQLDATRQGTAKIEEKYPAVDVSHIVKRVQVMLVKVLFVLHNIDTVESYSDHNLAIMVSKPTKRKEVWL